MGKEYRHTEKVQDRVRPTRPMDLRERKRKSRRTVKRELRVTRENLIDKLHTYG